VRGKLTEAVLQLRPRALRRVLAHRDRGIRAALRWNYGVGRRAWLFEVREFLSRILERGDGRSLVDVQGEAQSDGDLDWKTQPALQKQTG
jgi:anaerobic magnesium-protoporphyrin IX monomethyl ester cyclase